MMVCGSAVASNYPPLLAPIVEDQYVVIGFVLENSSPTIPRDHIASFLHQASRHKIFLVHIPPSRHLGRPTFHFTNCKSSSTIVCTNELQLLWDPELRYDIFESKGALCNAYRFEANGTVLPCLLIRSLELLIMTLKRPTMLGRKT